MALLALGETFTRNTLERATGLKLWDNGLGDLAEAAIERTPSIPSRAFSTVDLMVALGIMSEPKPQRGRKPNVRP